MVRFLRRPAVTERYGLPVSTLYDWISKGRFPKPVRLGERAVGWAIEELEAWERARTDARDDVPATSPAGGCVDSRDSGSGARAEFQRLDRS